MKKNILVFGALSIIALGSCNDNKKEESTTTTTEPVPAAQSTTAPVTTETKEGTTIQVKDGGVSFESKDGNKKTDVKISTDSSKIDIKIPK